MTVHREGDDDGAPAGEADVDGDGPDRAAPAARDARAARPWLVAAAAVLALTAVLVPVRVVFKQVHKPAAPPGSVTIANYDFGPTPLQVQAGAKVTFLNTDDASHTATADDKAFDTGVLKQGQSMDVTVQKTVTYHCDVHPSMQATIQVEG